MNAISPIEDSWTIATREVNAWRGKAVHIFACAEAEVGETLLSLRNLLPTAGIKVKQLAGHRFGELLRITASDGIYPDAAMTKALGDFQPHLAKRTLLCHGVTRIALERDGAWLLLIERTEFGKAGDPGERTCFPQEDGLAWLTQLQKDQSRLSAAARALRSRVIKPGLPVPNAAGCKPGSGASADMTSG